MSDSCSAATEVTAPGTAGRTLIFPNPASESVTIAATNGSMHREIVIRDAIGGVVWRAEVRGPAIVDVSGLAPGCYFVQQEGRTEKLLVLAAR